VSRSRIHVWLTLVCTTILSGCSGETGITKNPPPDVPPKFDYPLDDTLRMNHIQAKSTHNSYHIETANNTVTDWMYTHAPLDVQLGKQGVRQVELDIRFNASLEILEVYHLPILDEQTTCRKFTDCLQVLKTWSDAHRAHHALVVQIEMKDTVTADTAETYFAELHKEIRSVWPEERLFTPDELQGDEPTLREAVAKHGWPTLGELRGQVFFMLDDEGMNRQLYTKNLTSLAGRILFVDSDPSQPFGAVAVLNDPIGEATAINEAIATNMLVRAFVDGSQEKMDAALNIGVHFLTTDFPAPVEGMAYYFDLQGGTPSRCNPITAPASCTSEAIEDPKFVGP
jgi:Phosphoinositide phospholipase C, Ca2+-dependent